MTTQTVYPRFLGVDNNGDFVWELASGRWTWGDDPYQVSRRERTFTADRYLEKYGPVEPIPASDLLGHAPIPAKPGSIVEPGGWCKPAEATITREALEAAVREAFEDGKRRGAEAAAQPATTDTGGPLGAPGRRGAHQALAKFLGVLDGWIEGARSNHDGLDHRGELMGSECWTEFHPSDIRRMVNDAAREVGLSVEFADPEIPTEDKVR